MKKLLNKYPYSNKTEIFNSIESVSKLETRSSITLNFSSNEMLSVSVYFCMATYF
jgi:hypothetical protein